MKFNDVIYNRINGIKNLSLVTGMAVTNAYKSVSKLIEDTIIFFFFNRFLETPLYMTHRILNVTEHLPCFLRVRSRS